MGWGLALAGLAVAAAALGWAALLRLSRRQALEIARSVQREESASEKVRIVYTAQSLDIGGAEKVALDLMGSIDPRRFQIFLIIRDASRGPTRFDHAIKRAEQRGMIVLRKPVGSLFPYAWMRRNRLGKLLGVVPFLVNVAREVLVEYELYRIVRPHIMHSHKAISVEPLVKKVVARSAGIPALITTYHNFPILFSRSKYFPRRGLLDSAAKHVVDYLALWGLRRLDDVLVATSPEEKEAHADTGIAPEKIVVISNGIELSAYDDPPPHDKMVELKRRSGIPPDAFVFGHVARLNVQKAQDVLIEAARIVLSEIPEAYLVMIGDGEDRPALEAQIARIPHDEIRRRIIMMGKMRDIEVAQYYFMFDAFVLPSRFEGQGLVNMEAMAAGIPIIATRVGAVPSTVGTQAAILVEHDNSVALADAMRVVATDAGLRQRMGRAGRQRAYTRFKVEDTAARHEELYLKLLEQCGRLPGGATRPARARSLYSGRS